MMRDFLSKFNRYHLKFLGELRLVYLLLGNEEMDYTIIFCSACIGKRLLSS